jgi:predicted O-methyltransferase YrrM
MRDELKALKRLARPVFHALPSPVRQAIHHARNRDVLREPRKLPADSFVNAILDALGERRISPADLARLRDEVLGDALLAAQYERSVPRLRELSPQKSFTTWAERISRPVAMAGVDIFYVLFRVLRPALVIETGVALGALTSLILAALYRNGFGRLESFDLPAVAGERSMAWSIGSESEIGLLIPEPYREHWTLTLGDATYLLPRALEGRTVDCFFHDSDHSYEHQLFEYALAMKHLGPKGWLISDDISMSRAFGRAFGDWATLVHDANANVGIAIRARTDRA